MEACRAAVERWGADILEMDVRLTADGVVVVIHDETVDRTTDGRGRVADLDWDTLRSLDAGARFTDAAGDRPFAGRGVSVPAFEAVLAQFPHTRLNVEAKEPAVALPLADIVRAHDACDRVLLAAEHERCRRSARGYEGPWGASRHHVFWMWAAQRLPGGGPYVPGADILQVPEIWRGIRIVTPRLIEEAHRRNIPVHVWTVDDPADMHRLLSWGVDGIQTDRPDRLARVLVDVVGRSEPPGLAGQ